MEISTETGSLMQKVGERRAIEIFAKAGFHALDYTFYPLLEKNEGPWSGDGYVSHAKELLQIARDNGIHFNQAHGPFLFPFVEDQEPDYEKMVMPATIFSLRCAALLGIPHVVVHPLHNLCWRRHHDLVWNTNLEFYRKLAPYAKDLGVKIALENMIQFDKERGCFGSDMLSDPSEYDSRCEELDDKDAFVCLLDTGHSLLGGGDAASSIHILGPRLKALHVDDNMGVDDAHLVPYQGVIMWDDVLRALADIDYQGDFTFEALHLWERCDEDFYPVQARYLYEVGRHMLERLEQFRKEKR